MWHDSTSIKLAEEKLRMSEIKFHTICASAQDAIITIDNEGRVSYWNEAAEKMFGRTSEEVTGKEMHELIMPERFRKGIRRDSRRSRIQGGPVVGKAVELAASGKMGMNSCGTVFVCHEDRNKMARDGYYQGHH